MSSDLYECRFCKRTFSALQKKEHEKNCSMNFNLIDSTTSANLKKSKGNKDMDSGSFPVEQYSELKKLEQEPIYETKFLPINSQKSTNVYNKGGITFNRNQPDITYIGQEDNQKNINKKSIDNYSFGNSSKFNQETGKVLGDLKDLINEIQNDN